MQGYGETSFAAGTRWVRFILQLLVAIMGWARDGQVTQGAINCANGGPKMDRIVSASGTIPPHSGRFVGFLENKRVLPF